MSTELTLPRSSHTGPSAVASVFHVCAAVVLFLAVVAGIALAVYGRDHLAWTEGRAIGTALGAVLAGVLVSSAMAFFGYVLTLLVEIADKP